MTSAARQKRGNLRYAITYNVIWANQKTESVEYHRLRALAMFKIMNFFANSLGIGRHFKFCRYVNYMTSFLFHNAITLTRRHFTFLVSFYFQKIIVFPWRHFTFMASFHIRDVISHSWYHYTSMSFRVALQRICAKCNNRDFPFIDGYNSQTNDLISFLQTSSTAPGKERYEGISSYQFFILSFLCLLACWLACMLYLTPHQTIMNLTYVC